MAWQGLINPETISWLLEENNPGVRYLTLTGCQRSLGP